MAALVKTAIKEATQANVFIIFSLNKCLTNPLEK